MANKLTRTCGGVLEESDFPSELTRYTVRNTNDGILIIHTEEENVGAD